MPTAIALIYARYSPRRLKTRVTGEIVEPQSAEQQIDLCRAYCRHWGYQVYGNPFVDVMMSGDDEDRPELWRAVETVRRGWVLVVAERTRLARDQVLAEMLCRRLEKKGACVEAANGAGNGQTNEAKLNRGLLDLIGMYNRLVIGSSTRAAMRRHQQYNRAMSKIPPFGKEFSHQVENADGTVSRFWKENEEEMALVERILESGLGNYRMAQELNDEGTLIRGKPWGHAAIRRIRERARYEAGVVGGMERGPLDRPVT